MASFGRQFSGSPVLTMSPQPSFQAPRPMANFPRPNMKSFSTSSVPQRPTAGRKRSRDEAAVNLEADPTPSHEPTPMEGYIYGEGMTLIKVGSGYAGDATSQSGTWVDEKVAAASDAMPVKVQETSRKTQRLDGASNHTIQLPGSASSSSQASSANTISTNIGPVIDDCTLQLGIGWRKISNEEHIQAAARGWARYIENHYPLTNVRVTLESKSLESYLVEAAEGFFLFAENLRQGQLVSQNAEGTLRNLQSNPPKFDGAITLTATESPQPTESVFFAPSADTEMGMA